MLQDALGTFSSTSLACSHPRVGSALGGNTAGHIRKDFCVCSNQGGIASQLEGKMSLKLRERAEQAFEKVLTYAHAYLQSD